MEQPKRISTKVSLIEKRQSIFPYYAGFSIEFASWALARMGAGRGASVLDPWNGSGTTTTAARALGAHSIGVDLSPVLFAVARARLAPKSDALRLIEYFKSLSRTRGSLGKQPLSYLSALHARCLSEFEFGRSSPAAALALCCLFPVARQALAVHRTKNPSWFSQTTELDSNGTKPSEITIAQAALGAQAVAQLHATRPPGRGPAPNLICGDIRSVRIEPESIDCILTSPPYLTRLDYVQATYPELLLLGEISSPLDLEGMRKKMIGSPLTSPLVRLESSLPQPIARILDEIKAHSSKASGTYYHRFFHGYFAGMQRALKRTLPGVKARGQVCIVVQPSYYKDIYIDLPALIADLVARQGFCLEEVMEFDARNSMASVNKRAHLEARKPLHETALFFSKL